MPVSFRPEDRIFVQIAIDECNKLNLSKYAPSALIWKSNLPVDQPVLDHSYLLMPEALNGKILAQDARPLIMSAILQKERVKRINPPDRSDAVLLALLMVWLFAGVIFLIPISNALGLGPPSVSLEAGIFWGWVLSLFIGSSLLRIRNNRKQRLESDFQVAQFIGSEVFLQTLRKIESLNLPSRRRRMPMSSWPTLSQRIANLKNPTLPVTEKDALEAFQKKWGMNKPSHA